MANHRIWVIGDSIVRRAHERALSKWSHQLGTSGEVTWLGEGGAMLINFPRVFHETLQYHSAPSMIIIHFGTNDIGKIEAKFFRQAVTEAISTIRTLLPYCHIAWSSILPRLFYYNVQKELTSHKALIGVRISINKYARRSIMKLPNASYISHCNIKPSNHRLFFRDGVHLSKKGSDVLISNFTQAVKIVSSTI